MSVTPSRQGTYTGRRQRAPTLDAIWDSLISDLADLEVSVSDSPTSHFLHHKRYSKLESPYLPSKPPKRDPPSPVPPTTRLAHRRYTSVKKPPPQPIVVTETSPDSERLVSLPSLPHTRFRGLSESVRLSRILPSEKSPRFPHSNYRDKLKGYHPSIREQSQEEMKELWERIEENKNAVRRYAPEERIKTLREKAMHEDVRIQISKATRDEIALSRRKRLEDDLNNKLRRFEWRMNAASISIGKMRWTGLVGAFAVLGIWDQKMRNRRVTHIFRRCTTAPSESSPFSS